MSIPVLMPALSPTMTEGKLAKWHVKVGDTVKSGQVICEIETDKATMEVEAVDEGTVAQILIEEGTEGVAVNTPICILAAEGESAADAGQVGAAAAAAAGARRPKRRRPTAAAAPAAASRPRQSARAAGRASACRRTGMEGQDRAHDRARGPARRHGRGDAARRQGLPDGRGSRAVPGRLQGQPGPARGVRRQARDRHADHRARLRRPRRRRGVRRPEADRRVHDLQLRHAGDRPDHQFGGQDALHVGRPDELPDRVPRPQRRRGAGRRPAFAVLCELVRPLCRA